jgi:hypothetical protein
MVGQWSGGPRPLPGGPDPKRSSCTSGCAVQAHLPAASPRQVDFAKQGDGSCRTVHSGQWGRVAVAVSIAVCRFGQGVNALC